MRGNNEKNVETAKPVSGTVETAVGRAAPSPFRRGKYANIALPDDDMRVVDDLALVLAQQSGGRWGRAEVARQATRLLAREFGIDAPAPALPLPSHILRRSASKFHPAVHS